MSEIEQVEREAGRSPLAMLLVLLATFVALCVAACLLPHDRYIRYQQLSQTLQFRQQWNYERVHFDPTPIDIALIGVSRTQAAISGPRLTQQLSAALGRPVNVANLSMPQQGRNAHFVAARDLLENRAETRVLILAVVEQMPRHAHPVFRNIAELDDVISAPALINYNYVEDLAFMPWRQLALFVQTSFPQAFGVSTRFDAANYLGTDLDTTHSFLSPPDNWVDRDHIMPEADLAAASADYFATLSPPRLPPALVEYEFAGERSYTRQIAEMARANGTQIVFLYLPIYQGAETLAEGDFVEQFGPVLSAGLIASRADAFSDYGHANRIGAALATDWLAQTLAARLDPQTLHLPDQEQ